MMRRLTIALLLILPALAFGQPDETKSRVKAWDEKAVLCCGQEEAKAKPDGGEKTYARGRVVPTPAMLDARHGEAFKRHDHRMRSLPKVTLASYDLRTLGCVPAVRNQGGCGSCYWFSGADTGEICLMKAGQLPVGNGLAKQYGMDCKKSFGGCNGGDEAEVIDLLKTSGMPTTDEYGPYRAAAQACKNTAAMKFYKIKDWGYVKGDQGQGKPSVQEMKNAILQYGPISIAIDAAGFDPYTGGVFTVTGRNIDHAVIIIGFVDDASAPGGGYFILRNSWTDQWGESGYMKLSYASYFVEAIWVTVTTLPPPPVSSIPVITSPMSATATIGVPFTYTITATNNPTAWAATDLPQGLTRTGNVISGTPASAADTYPITLEASNDAGKDSKQLVLTLGKVPPPPTPGGTLSIVLYPDGTYRMSQVPAGGASIVLTAEQIKSLLDSQKKSSGSERGQVRHDEPQLTARRREAVDPMHAGGRP